VSRVSIIIQSVPETLVDCVQNEAEERDRPISWIVAETLCRRYGIPFEPTYNYRRPAKTHRSTTWVMRVPAELREALITDAHADGTTVRARAIEILSEHCNPSPQPRRKSHGRDAVHGVS